MASIRAPAATASDRGNTARDRHDARISRHRVCRHRTRSLALEIGEQPFDRQGDEFAETMRTVRRLGETPVDVAGTPDDAELDHHLWLRIGELVPDYARASVLKLPADVRVYFLTRLFEYEALHDGPEAFVQICPELLGLVAPAYRHLGLDDAARWVDLYVASEPTIRLLTDPDTLPTAAGARRTESHPRTGRPPRLRADRFRASPRAELLALVARRWLPARPCRRRLSRPRS